MVNLWAWCVKALKEAFPMMVVAWVVKTDNTHKHSQQQFDLSLAEARYFSSHPIKECMRTREQPINFLHLLSSSSCSFSSPAPFTKCSRVRSHVPFVLHWNYCATTLKESGSEKAKAVQAIKLSTFHPFFHLQNRLLQNWQRFNITSNRMNATYCIGVKLCQ